jgi:hypothetical protein
MSRATSRHVAREACSLFPFRLFRATVFASFKMAVEACAPALTVQATGEFLMKRSLLLLCLAAICCTIAGCAAKNQDGNRKATTATTDASGAADNAPAKTDVAFARETVEGLLNGDTSVAPAFDWENLKVPGADAGSAYREMPDDENREGFRQGFIRKFSESFKASGASVGDLKNWREQGKEGEASVVAVDTKTGKTMHVFIVRRNGRQQVSELAIE